MKAKVLIAEDDPSIALSLEFLLQSEGYEVRVARDGEEALRRAASFSPDVLLLDLMMPAKSGYEVCRELHAAGATRVTRIVILTARGGDAERDKGLALGAAAYVTKPFSTRELLATVREVLSGRAASEAAAR